MHVAKQESVVLVDFGGFVSFGYEGCMQFTYVEIGLGLALGLVVDELVNDMCCVLLFGLKYN